MDMNKETLERMRQMRLLGMYSAFKSSLEGYSSDSLTNDQFVSWLISNEWDDRCNKMIQRLIKNASFRYTASIEEIDYTIDRGLDKNLMDRLADLSFVRESRDLFITGSTGTGKSYIATALGMRACQKGMRVMYANTYRLMGKLKLAKAKGDIIKELKRIEKTDVLIMEDFCMHPFDAGSRMSLMDIIEDRYGKKTTILTSQVPVKNWYDLIGDKTVADAILDRLVHNALRIELKGESLRKLLSLK
ncbi:MAG: DNA replication protein [bacterium F083]|nr:MAG: DNA replication protein [bacterium F083]